VVNIGTLSGPWVEGMKRAVRSAMERNTPFVLDPVGAGATPFRTETVRSLLSEGTPRVIRGNASEVMSLHTSQGGTKGVDSTESSGSALEAARFLAQSLGCAVSISGETDYIVSADQRIAVSNGHPLMGRVTGMGCTASALTGAFLAVNSSPIEAAAHAMAVMGICGEIAAEKAAGPGSLQLYFLDALYELDSGKIERRLNVTHETH
jgi:hydroxyethylthiazole kinase